MGATPSKPQLSVVVAPAVGDRGAVRRLESTKDRLFSVRDIDPSIRSVYDLLLRGARVSEKAPCLGACA
jgi:hypothetical protein